MTPEAFLQVLMSISQFKALSVKTLLDPTMILSLLSKFSDVVTPVNSNSAAILFYTPPLRQDNRPCQITHLNCTE